MAELPIEDKYYEATLSDGTVIFTRTRFVVNAIQHYRKQCIDIINHNQNVIRNTPRVMAVTSFEEAMKEIDKLSNAKAREVKATQLLEKLDKMLAQIIAKNKPPQGQSPLGPS